VFPAMTLLVMSQKEYLAYKNLFHYSPEVLFWDT